MRQSFEQQQQCQPTPSHDHAASRLVKTNFEIPKLSSVINNYCNLQIPPNPIDLMMFLYVYGFLLLLPDQFPIHPSLTPAQMTKRADANSRRAMKDFM